MKEQESTPSPTVVTGSSSLAEDKSSWVLVNKQQAYRHHNGLSDN